MTIADWCLLSAVFVYLLTLAPFKWAGLAEFDNKNPRDEAFFDKNPVRRLALGAHQNGIETFPFFAAAVLLAEFRGVAQSTVDALAVGFMIARLVYVWAYFAKASSIRSLVWIIGFALNVALFTSPLWAR